MPDNFPIHMECVAETFRPSSHIGVRWLDWEEDFVIVQQAWFEPLTYEAWLGFRDQGYRYCAIILDGKIVSQAAVWTCANDRWEVAAVLTKPKFRNRGFAKSLMSFANAYILQMGRRATCTTANDNQAMQKTAASVGFHVTAAK